MPQEIPHIAYDLLVQEHFRWRLSDQRRSESDDSDHDDDDEHLQVFEEHLAELSDGHVTCPYCDLQIPVVAFRDNEAFQLGEGSLSRTYLVASCTVCGYWRFLASEYTNKCMDSPAALVASSTARKFAIPIPTGCAHELAQYLSSDLRRWDNLSPIALERLVADIYRANHDVAEVFHVGKPGDLGIDVLFIDTAKTSWLIQVKRRRSGKVEGFSTLQSLLGTLALHGALNGIIVSTADYFSAVAEQQRRNASRFGFEIKLIDRGKLHRMISPLLPDRPWLSIMNDDRFSGLDDEVKQLFGRSTRSAVAERAQQRLF